jgi:hypothetical protein
MPAPAETCARLLAALEDLVAQEAVQLRAADFPGVLATQERAAPLIGRLAALATTADAAVRVRIAGVLALRSRSLDWLGAEMARVRDELSAMQVSRRRVAQIAPVYGARGPAVHFRAEG